MPTNKRLQFTITSAAVASRKLGFKTIVGLSLVTSSLVSTGCVSLIANVIHAIKGDKLPAEFEGLKGKRVAVVVATDSGYTDSPAELLSRYSRDLLQRQVEDIDLVRQEEIEEWMGQQDWEQIDHAAIGRGVKADFVVAIDMSGLELKDGATLFRGRCDATTTVFDMSQKGKPVFRKSLSGFSFPTVGGQATTTTDEASFRRLFLSIVAQRVTRYFYPFDPAVDVAADAEALAF